MGLPSCGRLSPVLVLRTFHNHLKFKTKFSYYHNRTECPWFLLSSYSFVRLWKKYIIMMIYFIIMHNQKKTVKWIIPNDCLAILEALTTLDYMHSREAIPLVNKKDYFDKSKARLIFTFNLVPADNSENRHIYLKKHLNNVLKVLYSVACWCIHFRLPVIYARETFSKIHKIHFNHTRNRNLLKRFQAYKLSLIHIWRCRRYAVCRSRWSPYH